MSKELTEQWRDGTLPCGAYYVNRLGETRIYFVRYEDNKNTHEIYEVLAPVPSYEEYQDIIQQNVNQESAIENYIERIKELEKKLAIATKALKGVCVWANTGNGGENAVKKVCEKAIKEMEGVK